MMPPGTALEGRRQKRIVSLKLHFFRRYKGIRGITAFDGKGPTTDFAQAFGEYLSEPKVSLTREQAKAFCAGQTFAFKKPDGIYLPVYRGRILGVMWVKRGEARPRVDEKRARNVFNL